MQIKKEIVEVVERAVKREYNLVGFTTTEFSIRPQSISIKLADEGTDVSVKVKIDKALEFYYEHLIEQEQIDGSEVSLDEFILLSKEGVEVAEMVEEIQARSE